MFPAQDGGVCFQVNDVKNRVHNLLNGTKAKSK